MIDVSLDNLLLQKSRAVASAKAEEKNGSIKAEEQEELPTKVTYVPAAEVYKYNPNLREMEDKVI